MNTTEHAPVSESSVVKATAHSLRYWVLGLMTGLGVVLTFVTLLAPDANNAEGHIKMAFATLIAASLYLYYYTRQPVRERTQPGFRVSRPRPLSRIESWWLVAHSSLFVLGLTAVHVISALFPTFPPFAWPVWPELFVWFLLFMRFEMKLVESDKRR